MRDTLAFSAQQLQQLRELVEKHCGIQLGDAPHHRVTEGILRLMRQMGTGSWDEFIAQVSQPKAALRDKLLGAFLSRQTQWFRDPDYFKALVEDYLSVREEQLGCGSGERIRVWSAGCSTGQEPYSLVMALLDRMWGNAANMQLPPAMYEIVATDISPAALFLAVAGRYSHKAMEPGLPEGFAERYFDRDGLVSTLNGCVRQAVRFRQSSVTGAGGDLASGPFDLVLLRHVLEYYQPAAQAELLAAVAARMAPGALVALGADEQFPDHQEFTSTEISGCTFYRRD